ncbi:MAG: hypothetical protein B7Z31_10680 [Rhodobacterales bacterium 12-65-15]|nr:MAG: hypothetical protein B7Z31_10680 [Rhodobacterales bacterium 12-65-15]
MRVRAAGVRAAGSGLRGQGWGVRAAGGTLCQAFPIDWVGQGQFRKHRNQGPCPPPLSAAKIARIPTPTGIVPVEAVPGPSLSPAALGGLWPGMSVLVSGWD